MDFKEFQKNKRRNFMPSGDELAEMAQNYYDFGKEEVEDNFNDCLENLLWKEYEMYLQFEKKCSTDIISEAVNEGYLTEGGELEKTFKNNYEKLDTFFLSISQSRKARAGGSFEKHVHYLFEKLGYPFDKQTFLNGKVDYVIPSEEAFRRSRVSCVVISLKRTLRERWRQVIGELSSTNAGRIYLLTADKEISENKVDEINSHNIILVIWKSLKHEKFMNKDMVIHFDTFSNIHLPNSRKLWGHLAESS